MHDESSWHVNEAYVEAIRSEWEFHDLSRHGERIVGLAERYLDDKSDPLAYRVANIGERTLKWTVSAMASSVPAYQEMRQLKALYSDDPSQSSR